MRRWTLVGMALVLIVAGGAQAQTRTTISISATTANKPVGGLVWTLWGGSAQITGSVSDGQAGASLLLQASAFPFQAFSQVAQSTTAAGGAYAFRALPTLATQYRVVLASDPTTMSPVAKVYTAARWIEVSRGRCGTGPTCKRRFAIDIVYPAAVAAREAAKPAYFYLGVRHGSQTPPAAVRLIGTGRQQHVSGNRYRAGFTTSFSTIGAFYYEWEICTKDSEAADGLGLPGHHHCGDRSISYSTLISSSWIG